MPKILGLNVVAVLVATLVFWMLGFVWYGVIFMEAWMAGHGLVADQAGGFDIYMISGILITLMQVLGLGLVLKWKGANGLGDAVTTVSVLWLLLAVPFVMYAYLYLPAHNSTLLMIDGSHLLVGWVVTAIVYALIK